MSNDDAGTSGADAPAFAEPWQARAFALAVSLTDEESETAGGATGGACDEEETADDAADEPEDADGGNDEAAGLGYRWRQFQLELVAEIDARGLELDDDAVRAPEKPTHRAGEEERYYEQWLSALEHLLTGDGVVSEPALRERALEFERGDRDAHEFVAGDPHEHAERLPEGHADGSDHDHGHSHEHDDLSDHGG